MVKIILKHIITFIESERFIDFWMSSLTFICGLYIFSVQPIENIIQYNFMLERGITSNRLGSFATIVGFMNILRTIKFIDYFFLCIPCGIILQCMNLSFFLLLFFSVLNSIVIPIGTIFYGMCSLLYLKIIIKNDV